MFNKAITFKQIKECYPRLGERVAFTTFHNNNILYDYGIVKKIEIIDDSKFQYKYTLESDHSEIFEVSISQRKKAPYDTIILTRDNDRDINQSLLIQEHKIHYMYRDQYNYKKALNKLPKIGDTVSFQIKKDNEIIQDSGIVLDIKINNILTLDSVFIIEYNNSRIKVFHNSNRHLEEKIIF